MPTPHPPDDPRQATLRLLVLPDGRVVEDGIESPPTPPPVVKRRLALPLVLFVATIASTFWAGATLHTPVVFGQGYEVAGRVLAQHWREGLIYSAAVLAILVTHEMGHFIAAFLHRIPSSLPYFLPVPFIPFGTMGAVIRIQGSRADRRAMFDLGVAGPIAGLVVAVPIVCLGIVQLAPPAHHGLDVAFHNPLIFTLVIKYLRPDLAGENVIYLSQFNSLVFAGWVGVFVTGLNMLPVSQLDGGHVAYALLGRRAHLLARGLIIAAIAFIVIEREYIWVVMLTLVCLMGPDHPPTADDRVRLGPVRTLLGWAALTIPILCFSPFGIDLVTH